MSGLGLTESEKKKKMSEILTNLKSEGNLLGVVFAERNGKVVSVVDDNEFNYEEFSSMCASVLESALELSRATGDKKLKRIITELNDKIIIILECDNYTFIVLTASSESHVDQVMNNFENNLNKLLILY